MTDSTDIDALREAEISWLTDALGAAIANLGYPVGCGVAPNREQLLRAAGKLVDRYLLMPKVDENSLKRRYAVSHWEDRGRNRLGVSKSDMHSVDPTEYWIKP